MTQAGTEPFLKGFDGLTVQFGSGLMFELNPNVSMKYKENVRVSSPHDHKSRILMRSCGVRTPRLKLQI